MERLTKHHTTGSGPGTATSSPSRPRGTGVCRAGRLEIRQHLPCDSPRTLEILPTYLRVFLRLPQRNSTLHCDQHNGRRSDMAFNPPRDTRALCAARRCTFCMGGSLEGGYPTAPGWQEEPGRHSVRHSWFADEEMDSIPHTLVGQRPCKAVNRAWETPTGMMAEGSGNGPNASGRATAQKKREEWGDSLLCDLIHKADARRCLLVSGAARRAGVARGHSPAARETRAASAEGQE